MNSYQLNYFTKNILDKVFKISQDPKLFGLYFNEYFKDIFLRTKIDSYIVSYPKSGRTWLYKILSLYSQRINIKNYIKNRKMIKFDNKFIKFVHDCGDPSPFPIKPNKFRNKDLINKKKIILLRDPREVIISFWYQTRFREKIYKKEINEFIEDEYLGIEKLISFYNFINLNSLNNAIILTYQSLVEDTFEETRKILLFLDLEINENLLKKCISDCLFDKLQKEEMLEAKKKDIREMKFRKGILGSFNDDLSKTDLTKINNIIKLKLNNNFKRILNLTNI